MKKKFSVGLIALALCLMFTGNAFAGVWKQSETGWWYERDDKSYPVSTWENIDGSWYYFNESGYMLSNQWVGNYYVGPAGNMLTNTVIDGKQLGNDGAYIESSTAASRAETVNEHATHSHSNELSVTANTNNQSKDYILNRNTHKFHYPSCTAVSKMKEKNKLPFSGSRDEVISKGYVPCQICNP